MALSVPRTPSPSPSPTKDEIKEQEEIEMAINVEVMRVRLDRGHYDLETSICELYMLTIVFKEIEAELNILQRQTNFGNVSWGLDFATVSCRHTHIFDRMQALKRRIEHVEASLYTCTPPFVAKRRERCEGSTSPPLFPTLKQEIVID